MNFSSMAEETGVESVLAVGVSVAAGFGAFALMGKVEANRLNLGPELACLTFQAEIARI